MADKVSVLSCPGTCGAVYNFACSWRSFRSVANVQVIGAQVEPGQWAVLCVEAPVIHAAKITLFLVLIAELAEVHPEEHGPPQSKVGIGFRSRWA